MADVSEYSEDVKEEIFQEIGRALHNAYTDGYFRRDSNDINMKALELTEQILEIVSGE